MSVQVHQTNDFAREGTKILKLLNQIQFLKNTCEANILKCSSPNKDKT